MNTSYYNSLVEAFLSLKTKQDIKAFLDGILTPKEREELPVRLQIVKLLILRVTADDTAITENRPLGSLTI